MAALEAMNVGTPVVLSEECHLPEVADAHAGWQTAANLESLTATLNAALMSNTVTFCNMSRRARALVEARFAWPVVTRQWAEVYRWVAGGPMPQLSQVLVTP